MYIKVRSRREAEKAIEILERNSISANVKGNVYEALIGEEIDAVLDNMDNINVDNISIDEISDLINEINENSSFGEILDEVYEVIKDVVEEKYKEKE